MATFQKVTKMATVPIGAAAFTSASSLFLGRRTTSKSTAHVSNAASQKLHTAINSRYYHQLLREGVRVRAQNNNSTNMTMSMRKVVQRQGPANTNAIAQVQTQAQQQQQKFSSAATAKPADKSFVEWYEGHLQSSPVITKMFTGSCLWGLGDVNAQIIPAMFFSDGAEGASASASKSKLDILKELEYDYTRTARAMIYGFGIHAPLSHAHFNLLEWMTVKGGFTGLSIPVFKAFMEQIVYWSWISNSLYHGAMGTMQGKTPQEVYDRICDVLWETQKAQWAFWIPVQLLNFRFVPVRHQLNVVLLTSVVWTALLSAWYPPEKEGGDADKDALEEEKR